MSVSRRSLLGGQPAATTHIASLVVHCRPDKLANVQAGINALANTEIPASDDNSKLVVLLEMADESGLLEGISSVEDIEGVVSATLVFHQVDEL
jgi:nitrate reductase NapD